MAGLPPVLNSLVWVERGTVRVKWLVQEHNGITSVRARTRFPFPESALPIANKSSLASWVLKWILNSNHTLHIYFRGSNHCASVFWLGTGRREWQHQGMERVFFQAPAGCSVPGDTHTTLFTSRLCAISSAVRLSYTRTRALVIALWGIRPLW